MPDVADLAGASAGRLPVTCHFWPHQRPREGQKWQVTEEEGTTAAGQVGYANPCKLAICARLQLLWQADGGDVKHVQGTTAHDGASDAQLMTCRQCGSSEYVGIEAAP